MESKKSGLGEKEKSLLQRHWKTLKMDVRIADIVDNLIEEGVLSPHAWEDLKRKRTSEKDRTEEFLLLLQRKPSKCFGIFRDALRENGYEHLAEKLIIKEEGKQAPTQLKSAGEKSQSREANSINMTAIIKRFKDIEEREKQRVQEIAAIKQDHVQTTKRFEQKIAANLKQTNDEMSNLKAALKQKETEIEKLKETQSQQVEMNKTLSDKNRKYENEREILIGELQLKTSERDEMELKIKDQRLYHDKTSREKEKLQKTIERQKTLLEQEQEQKNKVMENLQRERTTVERMEREKEEMQDKIEILEGENEILSSRPQTARTNWSVSSSTTLYRRQPTGLSQSDDNMSVTMKQLVTERQDIEEEIKRKQIEQKYLKRRLREMQPPTDSADSKVCVVQ